MTLAHPGTLTGTLVQLEPLSLEHEAGLARAVADGSLWELGYSRIPRPERMAEEIRRRLSLQEQGNMLPFAARRKESGELIGMTTYMNIDHVLPRVEVGSTWNARSAQGSGTNADSKLLLLQHAFEVWECPAVEFRTDYLNQQSRAAIERLGAKLDGVLRSHTRPAAGYVRDTAVYSIIASEWPGVKYGLQARVARRG